MEHVLPSKFLFNKIHYGGGRHIEIRIYGHHLATFHEIFVHTQNECGKPDFRVKSLTCLGKI